jgi:hypothetical protein
MPLRANLCLTTEQLELNESGVAGGTALGQRILSESGKWPPLR